MDRFRPEEVITILDFEDTCHSYLVFECGSLLTYAFSYMPHGDIGQIGASVMKGFSVHQPLTEPEWTVLYDTVLARLVQGSVYGLRGALLAPENADYILESQKGSWQVFHTLMHSDKNELIREWKSF